MNIVGISTDVGHNYGSLLQAFATKRMLFEIGYKSDIFHLNGSLIKGKDVRLSKLVIMALRMLLFSKNFYKSVLQYKESFSKELSKKTVQSMSEFIREQLDIIDISYKDLKKISKTDYYTAFLCGSDQIWITDSFYIDPFYYLSYAPKFKRISFAPSFGREFVPEYNKKTIAKKISEIPYLSVREKSGEKIVCDLTGRTPEVLVDPSLGLGKEEWKPYISYKNDYGKYLLAYFLDEPDDKVISQIRKLAESSNLKIVGLPYNFSAKYADFLPDDIGPFEFLGLIMNAEIVCTDSFHGTAFSLNFQRPFYTFERNYGSAVNQSTRIKSLLELTGTSQRYCQNGIIDETNIDFDKVEKILSEERVKVKRYLKKSIEGVLKYGNK